MDKFGIFNLLNSFLGSTLNNSNTNSDTTAHEDGKKSTTLNDLFSALSPILGNNNKKENNETQNKTTSENKKHAPLQSGMLNTIKSHDDFIKRVKEKAVLKK